MGLRVCELLMLLESINVPLVESIFNAKGADGDKGAIALIVVNDMLLQFAAYPAMLLAVIRN